MRNKEFTDPDSKLEGIGDGSWSLDSIESASKEKQSAEKGTNDEVREFLIIAFWQYDEQNDEIKVIREYVCDAPFIDSGNNRPLRISEQAKVAFWYE